MDSDQIDCFVEAYLEPAAAIQLQQEIRENSTLGAIATNPFFLCSVIGAYEPGADFDSRGMILDSLFRKLLEREQRRIGPEAPDGKQVASWAGAVAYHMLRRGELGEHAPLPRADGRDQESCDTLAATGLLIYRAGQLYFRHQLVQEYFAATALRLRIVHRRPATLLADQRWSEVVAIWCNLDGRLDRRLVRCLAARNLPWRRPRSYPTAALMIFELVSSVVFVVTGICVLLDLLLGNASALASPFRITPIKALALAAVLVALRVPWSCLNPHRRVIVNAAYVLGRTGYATALPNMIKAMGRVFHPERAQIAEAIAQFGAGSLDDSLDHIDRGLRSRRYRVRAGSVQALGALAARFPDNDAVLSKLVAVAAVDDPRLAGPLIEALGRAPQSQAREALASVLARVGHGSPFTSGMRLQPLRTLSIGPLDEPWEEELIRRFDEHAMSTQPLFMRLVMLQAMGALRLPGSADKLAAMAADPDEPEQVRNAAVESLGRIGSSAAAAHLIQLAASFAMREKALNALNQLQDAEVLPELVTAVKHEDWHIRQVAARALGRIGRSDAIPVLDKLAEDPEEEVRTEVAQALAIAGHKSAVPPLLRLARDTHREVREAALDGLTQSYPDLAMQELLKLAQDNAYKNRTTAIRALARYDSPEVERVLRRLGGDPDRQVSTLAQRTLEYVEARHHRGLQPWWRHPLEHSREFITRRLMWEDMSSMFREEKLAGTPFGQRINKSLSRIGADAEMMRRYRIWINLYFWAWSGALVIVAFLSLLALRLALSGAHLIFDYWAVVLIVLGAAGLTFLPGIRRALDVRVLGASLWILRFAAAVIIAVLALGAFTYTWWIWVLILMACALAAALGYNWLSVRRGRLFSAPSPSTAAQQMEAT
jgi:HEAT repeat protein